ncbi:MAG: hypothetical protein PUE12_01560 [Oscillospiraceae bacterium]|nr:hypothetical protein [Oscillospiraceae bacterium]
MFALQQEIYLDDSALQTASEEMNELSQRTANLKTAIEELYEDLTTALQTPCGEAFKTISKDVLVKPIDDLKLIVDHISQTLETIKGQGYYKDVFDEYENLNNSIKVEE